MVNISISVVIPVLDGATVLEENLQSILAQEDNDLEIIVIDGGSKDGTLDIVKKYNEHIAYFESGKDVNLSDAFNRGVARSSGDLVAILNSDDNWQTDTVKSVRNAYNACPSAGVYFGKIRFLDETTNQSYIRSPNLSNLRKRMSVFHPALFIKKSTYSKVGKYSTDYKFAMDSEWVHRAVKANIKFHEVDMPLANMRLGGLSDSNFVASLKEYRKSTLQHNLGTPLQTNFYFVQHLIVKQLTRIRFIRKIKQLIA